MIKKIKSVEMKRYGSFWALYLNGKNLIGVMVYKKGAIEIKTLVEKLSKCKVTPIPVAKRKEQPEHASQVNRGLFSVRNRR